MASVLVPVLYIVIVFGGLLVFSSFYRRRNANKLFEPYFPAHHERDIYVTLLQKNDPPASEALLKAALVRRAMTDVQRIIKLREDKPALQNLLQKGSIGDDLWNSLLAAEKELEAEILEVAAEANSFVEGWGAIIFQTATEMMHNEKMRAMLEQLPAARAERERKYGRKTALKGVMDSTAITVSVMPNQAAPQPAAALAPAPTSTPPATPTKPANGSAPSATVETVTSDTDGPASPTTPRTPS
ncbi:hypothetical protein OBBRIDRAFT_706607, partial [Obba rivulosa]